MSHTLLLADDSVTIQRVIELTFADEDIRVVAVSTGEQAIAAMEAAPPDIVLADVGMPGRNGYEVAQFIKETPRLAHTRVLLLTGAFEPIDHERAAAVGCDGVLVKPFEPQQVIARVRDLLAGSRESSSMGVGVPPSAGSVPGYSGDAHAAPATSIDEYFDRLDRALGGTSGGSPEASRRDAPEGAPARSSPGDTRPAATVVPSLADAFAALLAAEQTLPGAVSEFGWPAPAPPSEALVEEVARRVLERLSSTIRTTVSDLVSNSAERLVREEIDRIKASIEPPPGD